MLNNFANLSNLSQSSHTITPPETSSKDRRQVFAIVSAITPALEARGLSAENVWQWVRITHNVDSRSELSAAEWCKVAARLSAAQRDNAMLGHLVKTITATLGTCSVYRLGNSNRKKVYGGIITDDIVGRCQSHADRSGCVVEIHRKDADIQRFTPTAPVSDPAPQGVVEVRRTGNETKYVSLSPPADINVDVWSQAYADSTGNEVHFSDERGHHPLRTFLPTPAQAPTPAEPCEYCHIETAVEDKRCSECLALQPLEDAREALQTAIASLDKALDTQNAPLEHASRAMSAVRSAVQMLEVQ